MAEPTLTAVFGTGATQDANTVTIQKAVLVEMGLTANSSNRAESLLAAIVKLAASTLTAANFAANLDQSIRISTGIESITFRGADPYRVVPITVKFCKPDPGSSLDPDDY